MLFSLFHDVISYTVILRFIPILFSFFLPLPPLLHILSCHFFFSHPLFLPPSSPLHARFPNLSLLLTVRTPLFFASVFSSLVSIYILYSFMHVCIHPLQSLSIHFSPQLITTKTTMPSSLSIESVITYSSLDIYWAELF